MLVKNEQTVTLRSQSKSQRCKTTIVKKLREVLLIFIQQLCAKLHGISKLKF